MVLVMGVVNVTPDSFSDGGRFVGTDRAVAHGMALLAAGADILDIGGEATNPKATSVDATTEAGRILPVIERLAKAGARVSVDTTKADVARTALNAGATIINDISGGLWDPGMVEVIETTGAEYIAGHVTAPSLFEMFDAEAGATAITWESVRDDLLARLAVLSPAARARTWVDPGLGFGKGADPATNLSLIEHAGDLGQATGCPVVIGPSRKRFLRKVILGPAARHDAPSALDPTAEHAHALLELDAATVGACLAGVRSGARMLRVHNVTLLRAALALYTRISAPSR